MATTTTSRSASAPPRRPNGRVKEILETMREQRESFLASIHPTEAEAAAKKLLSDLPPPPPPPLPPPPSTIAARQAQKPPLFSPIEAEKITKRLNDSIRRRKERLARISTSADFKYRSPKSTGNTDRLRKVSSPVSITTASTEENTFFSGSQTYEAGYESDRSATQHTSDQYPNLEEIEEASESEKDAASDTRGAGNMMKPRQDSIKDKGEETESTTSTEGLEIEVEIASQSDLSTSVAERTRSSSKTPAPMMTLFGYTTFEDSKKARPPLLVTCTSNSSTMGDLSDDKKPEQQKQQFMAKPPPTQRTPTCETVVSGLSNYSDDIHVGPLGPTVEERKKQLLKTLSSTMKELGEIDGVNLQDELASIASSHRLRKSGSSSLSDIGISSASSFSFSSNGSDTSGWISNNASKQSSLVLSLEKDSLMGKNIRLDPTIERRPSTLDRSLSSLSSSSYDFENPLGFLPGEEEDEPKLLFTPPSPEDRKCITPEGKQILHEPKPRSCKSLGDKSSLTPNRVSFHKMVSVRMRTPDPEAFEQMIYPRGNLWNIAKSSGLSFDGRAEAKKGSVFRSADYVRYSAEHRCATRGGLTELTGMAKNQIEPLHKSLKMPKVNGKRPWKLKARGGSYHMAVWTRLSNNAQSPASIFRPRDDSSLSEERPFVATGQEKMPKTPAELAWEADQLRRCKRKCGAKGSFLYVCNETRRAFV